MAASKGVARVCGGCVLFCAFLSACNSGTGGVGSANSEQGTLNVEGARGDEGFTAEGAEESQSTRSLVRKTFVGEVGVVEVGGDNTGERVEEYLAVTGLDAGFAWCGAFVSWGFSMHKVVNPRSAWSPDWFPDSSVVYKRGAITDCADCTDLNSTDWKAVDVIGIWFQSKGRIAHVGVIDKLDGEYVITIEGNTNDEGSREGDGVLRKRRMQRQIYKVSRWIKD